MADDLYCAGCNVRIRARDTGICPRCGVRVDPSSFSDLAETMLFHPDEFDTRYEDDESFEVTDTLDGKRLHVYECETLLGRGCMGQVYLARHAELERRCALKILSPTLVQGDFDYIERFQLEGRAAASLVHQNVVTVHAIGEDQGYHFLEMEFVAGRSLQNLVDREGALTPTRATVLAAQIAEGLALAHRHGIVHRDLKLDNVLLTHNGIPKIADFGLAKRVAVEGEDNALCGTPYFMAPELFDGASTSPNTDVYALGVCYYLMLTGEVPYRAGSLGELRRRVRSEDVPNVRDVRPEVPFEMADCLNRMLARAPARRPSDGVEAAELLRAVGGQVRDIETLLVESFAGDETITWQRNDQRYDIHVRFPNGRGQSLVVEPSDHSGSEKLLLVYSTCCPASADFYEQALRLNSEISHGGLSLREIDGETMFVMIDTYPRATVDAEEIRRSVLEVAYRADEVEFRLTGRDVY